MSKDHTQGRERGASPELASMLKQQAQLSALEKKLKSIESAMVEQNDKIDQARAAVPSIRAIEAQIGDLLASEAAGDITEKERGEREAALNKEAAKARAAAAQASAIVSRVQATISGLEAQRRNANAEIARSHGKCRDALDALLMAEAERIGQAYLKLAENLYEKFRQLRAIDMLRRQAIGDSHTKITTFNSYKLFLPAFRVGGHAEHAVGVSKNYLFTDDGVMLDRAIKEATKTERARLESLGVALSWNDGRFRASEEPDEQTDEERSEQAA